MLASSTKKIMRFNAAVVIRSLGGGHSPAPQVSVNTSKMIDLELAKSAHNYHPIPVVLAKGSGVNVWDVDGKVSNGIVF
jgi:4-aminobutyrate aminotransferase-like enzyme